MQKTVKQSFGCMLRFFRGRTADKRTGKPLSQARLADQLCTKTGLIIGRNKVNNWETSKSYLSPQLERFLLTAIVTVLFEYKGIKSLGEANQLLEAGDYRTLNDEEIAEINLEWLSSPFRQRVDGSTDKEARSIYQAALKLAREIGDLVGEKDAKTRSKHLEVTLEPDIFISYNHLDRRFASCLPKDLSTAGFSVWWNE